MFIVRNNIIPFKGYKAITLWPFVFVRKRCSFKEVDENHENIHGRQQLEMLIIPFYIWYVIEYTIRLFIYKQPKRAYRRLAFEQEAYSNEKDSDYLKKRKMFAWFKYLK